MNDMLNQEEIDALLSAMTAPTSNQESRTSEPSGGDLYSAGRKPRVKMYDFKRPDKFAKDQIRTLQMMHEQFARSTTTSLSALLQSLVNVHVSSVDQLTYEEFLRSVPTPTCMAIINMDPLKGNAVHEIDPTITFAIIDRLFGGSGAPMRINRELTDVERSVMELLIIRVLGNLRESWSSVIDLRPRLAQIEVNPQFASIISPTEMVVLITLETKVGDVEGMTSLCIPYITIEPIISKLSAHYMYSNLTKGGNRENYNTIKERLSPTEIDVVAELGSTDLPMRDIVNLQAGDVIRLDRAKINSDLVVRVGNRPKYKARPGLLGEQMAVQITGYADGLERAMRADALGAEELL